MDRSLTSEERRDFVAWLPSSSLSTHEPTDELLIAFKLAKRLGRAPTSVIRAARGQQRQGALVDAVQDAVLADADIELWMDGHVRRLRYRTV